eukprot:CAMPEP_0196653102 /NCGR_PEP_ID=MMETSP1086-20130531/2695_1 /TAXON_ID=77921 /ORGANISM="Cyanoptyche  gloeocystis , Strain SAG4.97" /LENGTH=614 /DNA_ID=CAMNT_0041984111 /DNA_START=128 /DNA_END=1972 /DNA_ORIENTATION=-
MEKADSAVLNGTEFLRNQIHQLQLNDCSQVLAQTFRFVFDIPEHEALQQFAAEFSKPQSDRDRGEFKKPCGMRTIRSIVDNEFDLASIVATRHVGVASHCDSDSYLNAQNGLQVREMRELYGDHFDSTGTCVRRNMPESADLFDAGSRASYGSLSPTTFRVEESDADRKVETLFLTALELVRAYKRPPFDINTISNEMKRLDPIYDVHSTSYGRFLELCKHMSAKGYLYLTRIGGIPMVKAYGSGTKDRSKNGHLPTMPPSRHLWVGSVGPTVSKDQLYSIFSAFGRIESVSMHSNMGYAFIDCFAIEDAMAAKENLQGAQVGEKRITINFAKGEPSRCICVSNLLDVSEEQLYNEFSAFGPLEALVCVPESKCAFLEFLRKEDSISAFYSMQDKVLGHRRIQLDFHKTRDDMKPELRWGRLARSAPSDMHFLRPAYERSVVRPASVPDVTALMQRRHSCQREKDASFYCAIDEHSLCCLITSILQEKKEVRLGELGKFLSQRTSGFSFQQQQGGLKGFVCRHAELFCMSRDVLDNPKIWLNPLAAPEALQPFMPIPSVGAEDWCNPYPNQHPDMFQPQSPSADGLLENAVSFVERGNFLPSRWSGISLLPDTF